MYVINKCVLCSSVCDTIFRCGNKKNSLAEREYDESPQLEKNFKFEWRRAKRIEIGKCKQSQQWCWELSWNRMWNMENETKKMIFDDFPLIQYALSQSWSSNLKFSNWFILFFIISFNLELLVRKENAQCRKLYNSIVQYISYIYIAAMLCLWEWFFYSWIFVASRKTELCTVWNVVGAPIQRKINKCNQNDFSNYQLVLSNCLFNGRGEYTKHLLSLFSTFSDLSSCIFFLPAVLCNRVSELQSSTAIKQMIQSRIIRISDKSQVQMDTVYITIL